MKPDSFAENIDRAMKKNDVTSFGIAMCFVVFVLFIMWGVLMLTLAHPAIMIPAIMIGMGAFLMRIGKGGR